MSFFKLLQLMYSPRLKREILLFIEIALVIMVFVSVLYPPTDALLKGLQLFRSFPDIRNTVIVSETEEVGSLTKEDVQSMFPDADRIYWSELTEINGILICTISETLFLDAEYQTESGHFLMGAENDRNIPVIVNRYLAESFPEGSEIPIPDAYADVPFLVTGIIDASSSQVIVNRASGNHPGIGALLLGIQDAPYGIVILVENDHVKLADSGDSFLIRFQKDHERKQAFDEFAPIPGINAYLTETLIYNSVFYHGMSDTINQLFLFVLVPTLIISVTGYLISDIDRKKRLFALLSIYGLPKAKMVLLEFVSCSLLIVPAFLLGIFLAPQWYSVIHTGTPFPGINPLLAAACLMIFLTISLIITIAAVSCIKTSSIIKMYKGGAD